MDQTTSVGHDTAREPFVISDGLRVWGAALLGALAFALAFDLLGWRSDPDFIDHVRQLTRAWADRRVVEIEYEGAALASLVWNDPPSTLRVERARVVGPVVVPPGTEALAPLIRQRYGVRVMDRELHELHRALFGPVRHVPPPATPCE